MRYTESNNLVHQYHKVVKRTTDRFRKQKLVCVHHKKNKAVTGKEYD